MINAIPFNLNELISKYRVFIMELAMISIIMIGRTIITPYITFLIAVSTSFFSLFAKVVDKTALRIIYSKLSQHQ